MTAASTAVPPRVFSRPQWVAFAIVTFVAVVGVPLLNRVPPEGSWAHLPDSDVPLLGKFLCYAMTAVALDLVWGITGILSLGHGLFFALGGYCMGMYLMRHIGAEGVYRSELPDFMVFLDYKELPWFWRPFASLPFAAAMSAVAPGALAFVFGWFAFRSKITGVYLSIITQALTYAMMLLFFRNATGFGGNNGLTDFKRIAGYGLHEPSTRTGLYCLTALALAASYLGCRFVARSRAGRVLSAIRDAEPKVTFTGFDAVRYKLFAWTASAMLCGIAGALYVPQVGIINPSEMHPTSSIEMVLWVAVGGRGSLAGPIAGALIVNAAKSWLTAALPTAWLYVLGGAFVAVTLLLPRGLVGLIDGVPRLWRLARRASRRAEQAAPAAERASPPVEVPATPAADAAPHSELTEGSATR